MIYRVEVSTKKAFRDARGESIRQQVEALGVAGLQAIAVTDLYFLWGNLDEAAVQQLVNILLCDPIVEEATWRLIDSLDERPPAVRGPRSAVPSWQIEV